jgi:hypothetical protein
VGIGVGVGVAGVILLVGLWWWCVAVRRKRDKSLVNEQGTLAGRGEPMDPDMVQQYQQQQQRGIPGWGSYYDQQQHQQGSSVAGTSRTMTASPLLGTPDSPHSQPGMRSGYPPESVPVNMGMHNEYAQGYMHGVHSALAIQAQGQAQWSPPDHEIPRFTGAPGPGSDGSRGPEVAEIGGGSVV